MNIRQILSLFLLCISIPAISQKKIELQDIVSNPIFTQKTISGLRSMNDGMNYTTLDEGNKIVKYS